jgi:hypothetical protein
MYTILVFFIDWMIELFESQIDLTRFRGVTLRTHLGRLDALNIYMAWSK